jgi:4-diphosphocytidyl-2-C-methyl-D-erythritol kinase
VNITVSAPAKINIVLAVGPRRGDGYHELATVFHAIDLRDTVTVEPGPIGSGITMSAEGLGVDSVPLDDSNLAARAALLMAEQAGRAPHVRIHINKRIPVAGGMAGGSADAAATLVACDAMWGMRLPRRRLAELAAELGSDVPFALYGGTMLGRGRGEQLTPVLTKGEFFWVIAPQEGGLSTPEVYAECDRLREGRDIPDPQVDESVPAVLMGEDPHALARIVRNDLQEAALSLRPDLADVLAHGMKMRALAGFVSGSGPTCVFLAADRTDAKILTAALVATGVPAFEALGPAQGARLGG